MTSAGLFPLRMHRGATSSWFDLTAVLAIVLGGLVFLWDARGWASWAYIGNDQYGDADFWWRGVLQFSQGFFSDNINISFRMGYAVFGGLLVAVFGSDYAVFHKLLVLIFLGVAAAGYLVLRHRVGRPTALAVTMALVFSPYQAEWLSISTSDALGLIWNLTALLAFCAAFDESIRLKWLALGGIFLALGALTRPLMAIFIGPMLLLLLFCRVLPLRRRWLAACVLAAAYALPTTTWMVVHNIKTGEIALAGNDASAFFAASSPRYQVWTPAMYGDVEAAAKARLGISRNLTPLELNHELWRAALLNYRDEFSYHVRRLPGHVLALAEFSYRAVNPTDRVELIWRILVRGLLTFFGVAACLTAGTPLRAIAAVAIFALSIFSATEGYVVVTLAVLALLPLSGLGVGPIHRLVASYWWTGVAALYLIGGTWGPPLTPSHNINALGYRLGAQFLFTNDWLVILGISAAIGTWPAKISQFLPGFQRWLIPSAAASHVLRASAATSIALLAAVLAGGGVLVGWRHWQFAHATAVPMPALAKVLSRVCLGEGMRLGETDRAVSDSADVLWAMWGDPSKRTEGTRIFTGSVGPLVWQMPAQGRTRALFYQQDLRSPFTINSQRTDIEFPEVIPETPWRNRQGAFVVRSFREEGPHLGYPTYETVPQVQQFVPLSNDGALFDYSRAMKFPLARYASALAYVNRLSATGARLEWMTYPTGDTKRRWFILMPPDKAREPRNAAVEIDLSDALGNRRLNFSFRVEPVPGNTSESGPVTLSVESTNSAGSTQPLVQRVSGARGSVDVPVDDVKVDLPADAERVRLTVGGLKSKEMVRIVELQLVADDVSPGLGEALCENK